MGRDVLAPLSTIRQDLREREGEREGEEEKSKIERTRERERKREKERARKRERELLHSRGFSRKSQDGPCSPTDRQDLG